MNKYYFFLFFLINIIISSQNLFVNYEEKLKPNSSFLNNTLIPEDIKENYLESIKTPAKYHLFVSGNECNYAFGESDNKGNIKKKYTPFVDSETFFYRKINDTLVYQKATDDQGACYVRNKQIKGKTEYLKDEKIDQYNCKVVKITDETGDCIIWYTEDIPINAGPTYYWGFPGLVLKAEDSTMTIYATSVLLTNQKKEIKPLDTSVRIVEGADFRKYVKQKAKNNGL